MPSEILLKGDELIRREKYLKIASRQWFISR